MSFESFIFSGSLKLCVSFQIVYAVYCLVRGMFVIVVYGVNILNFSDDIKMFFVAECRKEINIWG